MSTATATYDGIKPGTAAKHAFFSAVVWLCLGASFGFFTSLRIAWPDLLNGVDVMGPLTSAFAFGRVRPMHIGLVIFGWISMAFVAAMYYMTPALCNCRLWSEKLGLWNIWLWNVGLVVAAVTLLIGANSGREYQEFIWPVDIYILVFVLGFAAINVFKTVTMRRTQGLYITIWFFLGSLVMIWMTFFIGAIPDMFPVTGLNEAYMVWWHAHNVLGLWITPVSAAIAYYVIPKVSGNVLYSHKIGHLHFWTIAAFYSTPGAHHLMGAPIPEWMKSFASVSGVMILIPALAFITNMVLTVQGKWHMFSSNVSLQFALTGTLMAVPLNFQGAFQQTRAINWYIHGTHWMVAHAHFALLGFSTFIEVGATYYAVAKLFQRKIYSQSLATTHYWLTTIGFIGFWTTLTLAGLIQASGKVYNTTFIEVVYATHPYMVGRSLFGLTIVLGQWIFLYNLYKTATAGEPVTEKNPPASVYYT